MRALRCHAFGPLENLVLDTVDDPSPGRGEVLVDIAAAGLNFPDLLIVQGKYQVKPPLPFVPGGECAGTVAALGEGVDRLKVGDPVIAMSQVGAFAEKIVIPESAALPMPRGMEFATAAGVSITYATSYYALKQQARLAPGETLLVLGAAGGVGLAAVELGKRMGARVIAAASSEEKLEAASAAGAELRINYCEEDLKQRTKELTEGRGADVVFDPVGGELSQAALRATAWNGRFLVIGFASGHIPEVPLNIALLKGAHIIGVFWGSWTERDPETSSRNFRELRKMFENDRLKPRITPYLLADYPQAFAELAERRAVGKLVLLMKNGQA